MLFKAEDLEDLLWNDSTPTDHGELIKLQDNIIIKRRWDLIHELIFRLEAHDREDQFFGVRYAQPATEMQHHEAPFGENGEEIECYEMEPYTKTVIAYKRKEQQ